MKTKESLQSVFTYLSWTWAIIFILGWVISLVSTPVSWILMILMGTAFLPPLKEYLLKNHNFNLNALKKALWFFVFIILLWIFGEDVSGPSTAQQEVKKESVEVIETLKQEDTIEAQTMAPQEEQSSQQAEVMSYSIEEKIDYSRKVLWNKNLSDFTSEELENVPIDKKFSYEVVMSEIMTQKQVEDTARFIIEQAIAQDEDLDELTLNIYSEAGIIWNGYDIWSVTWAVNGKLWDISPEQARYNIRTEHKIVFQIKDNIQQYLTQRKNSEDKFGLTLEERQEIFRAVVATEERARIEAEEIYPTIDVSPEIAEKNMFLYAEKSSELREKYKAEVIARFEINEEIESDIAVEGITYNWSY